MTEAIVAKPDLEVANQTLPAQAGEVSEVGLLTANGTMDTRKGTRKRYRSITLSEIREALQAPATTEKHDAPFAIFSSYRESDGRTHQVQRERGEYHALAGDVDDGSPSLDALDAALVAVFGDVERWLYSSASASPKTRKWRYIVPLAQPLSGASYTDTQRVIFAEMGAQGIVCDDKLKGTGQPVFLPNVPPGNRDRDGEPDWYQYRIVDGPSFDLPTSELPSLIHELRNAEEQTRQKALAMARRKAEVRAGSEGDSPIDAFNSANAIESLLSQYGYQQKGGSKHWRSPYQESGSHAIMVDGSYWVSLSGSDDCASIGCSTGQGNRCGDAFDLYCHFDHGGNTGKAINAYLKSLPSNAQRPPGTAQHGAEVSNRLLNQGLEDCTINSEDLAAKLDRVADRADYPIEALGPLLGSASKAIAETVDAPPVIAAHSVLAVAAFAAQDKANLVMDGRTIPLSLFMLTSAESGDRKSACDKVAKAPLDQWQRDQVTAHAEDLQTFRNAKAVYESEHKAALSGKGKSAQDKRAALEDLDDPEPPPSPIVICQEPTLEGLQKSFKLGKPSQALFSDEGAQFFGGHAMNPDNAQKTIAGLSKYWDGSPIVRTRAAQGESVVMFDRRLSIHLLVQPIIAQTVLGDPLLMQQGILARFLIAEASTLAGTRLYKPGNAMEHPAVIAFHSRVTALLDHVPATTEEGGLELSSLNLTEEARQIWIDAYNRTEQQLAPGRVLEIIKPMASKAAENANRIAGVFAVIEGTAEVTAEQMGRAWQLATYYLQGSLRGAQLNEVNILERDAAEVLEWLKERTEGKATIGEMQRKLIPVKHRKSVVHIRAIMGALAAAGAAQKTTTDSKGNASAWVVMS